MENPPFEDVFPIQDGDFPASYGCLPEGKMAFQAKTGKVWQLQLRYTERQCQGYGRLVSWSHEMAGGGR